MEIYTLSSNPFKFGGTHDLIKTKVEEYERVSLGKGFYGIVVYNPIHNIYHIAEEITGALVGTSDDKTLLIAKTRQDVEEGDKDFMEEQIKQHENQLSQALLLDNNEFFQRFRSKDVRHFYRL